MRELARQSRAVSNRLQVLTGSKRIDSPTKVDPVIASRAVLGRSHEGDKPPIDLNRVLKLWPQLAVTVDNLDGAGYLLDLGHSGEILLRAQDSSARRRFTLSHEIGHWLLGPESGGGHDDIDVERWCDRFAVALLLPADLLQDAIIQAPANEIARVVAGLPSRFRVSKQSLFLRVTEVTDVSLLVRDVTAPPGVLVTQVFTKNARLRAAHSRARQWAAQLQGWPGDVQGVLGGDSVSVSVAELRQPGSLLIAVRVH